MINIEKCQLCQNNISIKPQCQHNFCPKCIHELDNVCPECIGKLDYVIVKRNKLNLDKFYMVYDFCFCCSFTSIATSVGLIILYYAT